MAAIFRLSSEKQNNNNKDKMDPSPPSVPPCLTSSLLLPSFLSSLPPSPVTQPTPPLSCDKVDHLMLCCATTHHKRIIKKVNKNKNNNNIE